MEQQHIDVILGALRVADENSSPFRDSVWREIRHRKGLGEALGRSENVWFVLLQGIFAPMAIVGLAAAVLVAWGVAASWDSPNSHRTGTTTRVLDLGVFGPNADGLPHGRLVVNR